MQQCIYIGSLSPINVQLFLTRRQEYFELGRTLTVNFEFQTELF